MVSLDTNVGTWWLTSAPLLQLAAAVVPPSIGYLENGQVTPTPTFLVHARSPARDQQRSWRSTTLTLLLSLAQYPGERGPRISECGKPVTLYPGETCLPMSDVSPQRRALPLSPPPPCISGTVPP